MRRAMALAAALLLCLSLCPGAAASAEPALDSAPADPYFASGTCGDSIHWWLTLYGELVLEGTGAMYDYEDGYAPWYDHSAKITDITIGNGVTRLGSDAFNNCVGVTRITLPPSVTEIGDYAFSHCGLTQITIPAAVTRVGAGAFEYCGGLTSIGVESGNGCYTSRDGVLFDRTGAVLVAYPAGRSGSYTVPDGVTVIGAFAFSGSTQLTQARLPESLRTLEKGAFWACSALERVTLPNGLTSIGEDAFAQCGLTQITIPDGVTQIAPYCFSGCRSLAVLSLPAGVSDVGRYAFQLCSALRHVTFGGGRAAWSAVRLDEGNEALLAAAVTDAAPDRYGAALVLRCAVGLSGGQAIDPSAADINGDGAADAADAALLLWEAPAEPQG